MKKRQGERRKMVAADDRVSPPTASDMAISADPVAPTPAASTDYDEDAIRRRAYERYQARAGAEGSAETDWLVAESELRARRLSSI